MEKKLKYIQGGSLYECFIDYENITSIVMVVEAKLKMLALLILEVWLFSEKVAGTVSGRRLLWL